VIKKVGLDITPEDVIASTSLKIIKAWRITSRKTDRPTTLIRIIITERESLDTLLLNGIQLFGRNYECESSHPPAPTPVQCAKCFQFGHEQAACQNKQVCRQCPNSHPPNKCPAKDPICSSCKGPHPAWSRTCPALKEITITDDTPDLTIAGPPERPNFIPIDDFNQTNSQAYQRHISEHLPVIIQTTDSNAIDAQVTQFTETVIRAKEITVQNISPQINAPYPAPFWTKFTKNEKVYRRFILTRDPFLKTIFNKLNAQIRRDLNKYREDQWIDTCRSLDYRDGKSFWSRFQQITGQKKHSNHHLIHQNHQTLSTPQDKANCFAQTLQEINQVPDDPHFDNRFFNKVTQNVTNFFNIAPNLPDRLPLEDQSLTEQIHTEEVIAHIRYLKNRKALGPDSIKSILLKKLPPTPSKN
jgi:hypothetical protein